MPNNHGYRTERTIITTNVLLIHCTQKKLNILLTRKKYFLEYIVQLFCYFSKKNSVKYFETTLIL